MDSSHTEGYLHALVSGTVQGVFYRRFTLNEARALDLCGMVRNLPDGRVEVEAEGPEPALRELARRLRVGPAGARVTDVVTHWSGPTGGFSDFVIEQH